MASDLTELSATELLEREAQIQNVLRESAYDRDRLVDKSRKLASDVKWTGVKFVIDSGALAGSLTLSPLALGWSLLPNIVTGGRVLWDARALAKLGGELRRTGREIDILEKRMIAARADLFKVYEEFRRRREQ